MCFDWLFRMFRKKKKHVYETRRVGEPDEHGNWVAEILVDGVPRARLCVGSMSGLFARY